ncbi:MAG: hemerythrin domain-containing protein [Ramlibacter sp.]
MSRAPARRHDAVDLLDADHIKVMLLFRKHRSLARQGAPAPARQALARQICQELVLHNRVEEEVFYPALRHASAGSAGLHTLMDEADVEHECAAHLVAQIMKMDAGDSHLDARLHVLCQIVDRHVTTEREKMFSAARASGLDLVALVAPLVQCKEQALAEMGDGALG